jgi:hypothetical protein
MRRLNGHYAKPFMSKVRLANFCKIDGPLTFLNMPVFRQGVGQG